MRAHEIIRSVLDLIDKIENPHSEPDIGEPINLGQSEEERRLQQIMDLLTTSYQTYDNSPAEVVASIDSVTKDAGGGWNGPKHPADIRADSVAMYPNFLAKG
jgi:hypothetical protein